eukprot:NODE_12855_length_1199_cov_19.347015.p1 GENE.NODE_12855_length_1199_cov_19.347015~~NODE_12855_length_1199_cov_19.347015.p1  ORF type:complete len:272 (+),score=41.91 NODE_12855_length_1199_cov_19.347015:84-899(+)
MGRPPRVARHALVLLILSLLIAHVDCRGRRGGKSRSRHANRRDGSASPSDRGVPVVSIIVFICVCVGCFCAIFFWCSRLDGDPSPASTRLCMWPVFAAMLAWEAAFFFAGFLSWRAMPILSLASTWGAVDAIMRYPVVHSLTSLFALKQVLLIIAKAIACGCYFNDLRHNVLWFLGYMLMCLLTMPLMYLLALPLDYREGGFPAIDDKDIAVRAVNLVRNREARVQTYKSCRHTAYGLAVYIGRRSSLASRFVCRVAPECRSALHTGSRRV